MGKKTGALIKEARTAAGFTQEQLAKKITGISASDISKAERGEAELTQAVLKQIAKLTGVTQTSLLNAETVKTAAKSTAKSTTKTSAKAETKTAAKSTAKSAAKTAAKSTAKTAKAKEDEFTLTAAEKKLVELYRAADSDTKKAAVSLLKGEKNEVQKLMSGLLGDTLSKLLK